MKILITLINKINFIKFILLIIILVFCFLFYQSNPEGIWRNRFFVAYADGSFADLKISGDSYSIGDDLLLIGEVHRIQGDHRRSDLYLSGEYQASIKAYGPIIFIYSKCSGNWTWGYRHFFGASKSHAY
jgi:hypothetical protein